MQYTKYGYQIQKIKQSSEPSSFNWLFLPDGPGIGSEYLTTFCQRLDLPGTIWLGDFPRDGNNQQGNLDTKDWQEGLLHLAKNLPNLILVVHGFSAMFALMLPEVEKYLTGIILMNTTTKDTFLEQVSCMQAQWDLPDLLPAASHYHLEPTNDSYQAFWESYKHYCFTDQELAEGEKIMSLLAYNSAAYQHAILHYFPNYHSRWHPTSIPVMTLSSEYDYIFPARIFMDDEKYQADHIINKLILAAGHWPWLSQFDKVQQGFDDFIEAFLKQEL